MTERFLLRAAVYVVLRRDNEVLCIRRSGTGYRDGEYTLPAGHVEANETFLQTCVREAKEEICVDIDPADLTLVHVMQRHEAGVDVVDYYFEADRWQGEPAIGEPHKADDMQWLTPEQVQSYALPGVSQALSRVAAGAIYSHHGIIEP